MMRFDLVDLSLFRHVAEAGSITHVETTHGAHVLGPQRQAPPGLLTLQRESTTQRQDGADFDHMGSRERPHLSRFRPPDLAMPPLPPRSHER